MTAEVGRLTEAEREELLTPCACGHTLNDHGSIVACWACEDGGDMCAVTFEGLLAERLGRIVREREAKARAEAWAPIQMLADDTEERGDDHVSLADLDEALERAYRADQEAAR